MLDVTGRTDITDFFVIVSSANKRRTSAIVNEIKKKLKKYTGARNAVEGDNDSQWVLVDLGDCIVHVFTQDAREYYDLEAIWPDAKRIDWTKDFDALKDVLDEEAE